MSEKYTKEEWEFARVLYEARKLSAYGPDWLKFSWNVAFPTWRERNVHYMVTENVEVDMALDQAKAGLKHLRSQQEGLDI